MTSEARSAPGSLGAMDPVEEKTRWRGIARTERDDIAVNHAGFCRVLRRFIDENVDPSKRVVIYQAMADEVDLGALVEAHPDPAARYALTRTPDSGLMLTLHRWGGPQERHPFGYEQPKAGTAPVADTDIGAVLVPGLAFDPGGRRLGRGKGYYDRFLARLANRCLRVGITGDYLAPCLPTDDYDVTMTHLAFTDRVEPVPLDSAPSGAVVSAVD